MDSVAVGGPRTGSRRTAPSLSYRLCSGLAAVLISGVLASCCETDRSPVTFVLVPDLHLFDEGKPRKPGELPDHLLWQDDERAFVWAIDTISKIKGLKFVVFAGDLGLEMTGPYWESKATDYFAQKLSGLHVDHILFVPGNNDLLNEEPKDVGRYRSFVAELARKLTPKKVVDLAQGGVDIDGAGIHGLDTATFKNSISCRLSFKPRPNPVPKGWTVVDLPKAPVQSLWCQDGDDIDKRRTYQLDEMRRVANEINANPEKPHLLFTHIPPLDDPFSSEGEPLPSNLRLHTLDRWKAKILPLPWNLDEQTLDMWVEHVRPRTKCMFAAHFHTSNEASYGIDGVLKGNCDAKVVVSPPLAIKFQSSAKPPMQGFLEGTIAKDGTISYEIVRYPQ